MTYWEDMESLDKFTAEAVSCFHNKDFNKADYGYVFLTVNYIGRHINLCARPVGTEYPRSLCKAVKYIEHYLESDLTVEDIAQ